MIPLIILCALLAAIAIGALVMLALRLAFPTPAPKWPEYPEIEIAKVPVIEAGSVAYQFLGVTGEEQ